MSELKCPDTNKPCRGCECAYYDETAFYYACYYCARLKELEERNAE